jgi:hypothetical protein
MIYVVCYEITIVNCNTGSTFDLHERPPRLVSERSHYLGYLIILSHASNQIYDYNLFSYLSQMADICARQEQCRLIGPIMPQP